MPVAILSFSTRKSFSGPKIITPIIEIEIEREREKKKEMRQDFGVEEYISRPGQTLSMWPEL